MRLVAALAFAGALTASHALAADKAGPTVPAVTLPPEVASVAPSCYVSAIAGSSIDSIKTDRALLPATLSASGWTIGAGLGCDVRLERIVVGALARFEVPVDTDGSLIKADQAWMAAGRVGYLLNTGLMAYGLIGYSQADWKIDVASLDRRGLVVGGGLEIMVTRHLSLIAEYTRAGMGSTDALGIQVEPVNHSARIGITYRFRSLFGD